MSHDCSLQLGYLTAIHSGGF